MTKERDEHGDDNRNTHNNKKDLLLRRTKQRKAISPVTARRERMEGKTMKSEVFNEDEESLDVSLSVWASSRPKLPAIYKKQLDESLKRNCCSVLQEYTTKHMCVLCTPHVIL